MVGPESRGEVGLIGSPESGRKYSLSGFARMACAYPDHGDIEMDNTYTTGIVIGLLLFTLSNAWGANADETVRICRAAIAEAEGQDYSDVSLKKIKPRGSSYEAWFNVSDGDQSLKSYCYIKRGKVEQLVTTEGRWTSSNPKRPKVEEESETELAQTP